MAKRAKIITPSEDVAAVRKKLRHYTIDAVPQRWLDTGSENLNAVLGSASKGVPYGKILEVFGPSSHGKTMLTLFLTAIAQKQGAHIIWIDFENAFDPLWVAQQGLDPELVYVLRPQMGRFRKKTGEVRIQSAEELFREAEELVKILRGRDADRPIVMAVDSVAAIPTGETLEAGFDGQNMRTKLSLAQFLSNFLVAWTPFSFSNDVLSIFINQVRTNPGQFFGNPERTPGGNALPFYASNRVRVKRVKGGRVLRLGQVIGLRGEIHNVKNKGGGGGVEGRKCGYATKFGSREWLFPSAKEIQGDAYADWGKSDEDEGDDDE